MKKSLNRFISKKIQNRINLLSQGQTVNDFYDIEQVAEIIRNSERITVLTGAGISTMSGIPDYRGGVEGVWQKKPGLLNTLNQSTFLTNPKQFWDSYYDLFAVTLSELIPYETTEAILTVIDMIQPNEGHRFFVKLEKAGKEVTVLTQNVDGLHQKAGNKRVREIHGNIITCSCYKCGSPYNLKDIFEVGTVPTCVCGNVLRPDVVFFGDTVKKFSAAEEVIAESDLIIVAGTSLQVSPFNQLPRLADTFHIPTVFINAEAPENNEIFTYVLQGNISEICRLLGK